MRGQIGGLGQAQRNAEDGISLVQTAEGALNEVHSMLQRVRDLKVQYTNGTLSTDDKDAIRAEGAALALEITSIRDKTQFNGKDLLKGTQGTLSMQVGANDSETIDVATADILAGAGMSEVALAATYSTDNGFSAMTLTDIDTAIKEVSATRGNLGAVQNRLEHRLNNLATYQENLTSSESRIRDVDMASEMTKFTKLNILQQAGTSMLAQANQAPQGVLSLLR
jgi:flagellin